MERIVSQEEHPTIVKKELEDLVDRILYLPEELQVPILAELPFWKLQLVCQITAEGTRVRKFRRELCSDYEVVKGSLGSSGFILPENFDQWIMATKPPSMGLSEFIHLYFFADLKESKLAHLLKSIIQRSKLLWDVYKHSRPSEEIDLSLPHLLGGDSYVLPLLENIDRVFDEHFNYLLDTYALDHQIFFFKERYPDGNYEGQRKVTKSTIRVHEESTVSSQGKLSKFIIKVKPYLFRLTVPSYFGVPFDPNTYIPTSEAEESIYSKVAYIFEQTAQLKLYLISALVEEGDIIKLSHGDEVSAFFIYLDLEDELSLEKIGEEYLLPSSAIPFLIVRETDDLGKLWQIGYRKYKGFVTPEGRKISLALENEQFRPVVIDGFTFKATLKS